MILSLLKILWQIFNPLNLFFYGIVIALLLSYFKFIKFSRNIFIYLFIYFLIFAIFPTGRYLTYLLESEFYNSGDIPDSIDGVLILAGVTNVKLTKEFGQVNFGDGAERLTESILIIKRFPNAKIIFSGGAEDGYNNYLYSDVAKMFYLNMGLDIKKIIFESKSINTYQNINFSKQIAKPKKNEDWLVISSAFHLKRVLNIASNLNWKLIPYATDYKHSKNFKFSISFDFLSNINQFQMASYEWFKLIYYKYLKNFDDIS